MKEEINEVVAFLQNPNAFQEMGARAPRVCHFIINEPVGGFSYSCGVTRD